MLLRKRVFCVPKYKWGTGSWRSGNVEDYCGRFEVWVRKHFELPKRVSKAIISLHSRPSVDREKGRIKKCSCGCGMITLLFGRTELDAENLSSVLRPLIGRTVYLEVEYEI